MRDTITGDWQPKTRTEWETILERNARFERTFNPAYGGVAVQFATGLEANQPDSSALPDAGALKTVTTFSEEGVGK